jgi:chromate reductase, NAD(P)H dehydrogenase (quinone)
MKWFICIAVILSFSLSAEKKVLAFAGSTRVGSYNKKLVNDAAEIARKMGAAVTVIDLKDYTTPFYDADVERKQGMAKNAKRLRDLMIHSDAILIASPEYNGSISAVLKNALDWASRDEKGGVSTEAFKGKRFALMSASPGKKGGCRGLLHLRTIIEDLGGIVVPTEVSIPSANIYFAEKEKPENQTLIEEIQELLPSHSSSKK